MPSNLIVWQLIWSGIPVPPPDLTYESFALSGTDGAWQLYTNGTPLPQYLFYKDNRIVVLRPDWGISQSELEQAASILLPESL